jgi:hypothetical protein
MLLPELSSALPRAHPAPAVGLGDEHVGSSRRSARAIAPPSSRAEALERSLAFKRWARGRCYWRYWVSGAVLVVFVQSLQEIDHSSESFLFCNSFSIF